MAVWKCEETGCLTSREARCGGEGRVGVNAGSVPRAQASLEPRCLSTSAATTAAPAPTHRASSGGFGPQSLPFPLKTGFLGSGGGGRPHSPSLWLGSSCRNASHVRCLSSAPCLSCQSATRSPGIVGALSPSCFLTPIPCRSPFLPVSRPCLSAAWRLSQCVIIWSFFFPFSG